MNGALAEGTLSGFELQLETEWVGARAQRTVSWRSVLRVDYVAESNVVDRQISNLRVRLHDDWRKPRLIATVPGRGYRFLPTSATPKVDSALLDIQVD